MGTTPARRQRARNLRILNAIAEALNSSPDVQGALARALALVADLLGLQTGWVWLLDPETDRIYIAAAQNLPPYLQEPVRMTGKACWCLCLFREGCLTPTNIECSRLGAAVSSEDAGATGGLRYHASIPLYFGEKPLGVMNLAGPEWRRLSPDELQLLSTIAYQVGIAIERARLAEETTRLARVEERARIAREIHDTLAQGLTAIALHVESAMRHIESHPARARERLSRALATAQDSLEEARRSVLDLRPPPSLIGRPLAEALRALAREFTSETGIRVRVRASPDRSLASGAAAPPALETELYRIAREALVNVRRHSKATETTITLSAQRGRVRVSIHDNGIGFDPLAVSEQSYGIRGMRERAKLLGGQLRITSRPGRGTTVTVTAPLPGMPGTRDAASTSGSGSSDEADHRTRPGITGPSNAGM